MVQTWPMGNQIRGPGHSGTVQSELVPYVKLSNTATAVAVSLLSMAATALAVTDSQRRLASAITTLDQSVRGRGTVGFDLTQLPCERHHVFLHLEGCVVCND